MAAKGKGCDCGDDTEVVRQYSIMKPPVSKDTMLMLDNHDDQQLFSNFKNLPLHPLLLVASHGHQIGVKRFISAKFDLNIQSPKNFLTAAHMAANGGHAETLELLIRHGASLQAVTKDGHNPLMMAIVANQLNSVLTIWKYKRKFNINEADKKGNTALHLAAKMNWCKPLSLLLSGGADMFLRNKDRRTAFNIAVEEENQGAINHLLDQLILTKNVKSFFQSELQLVKRMKCSNTSDDKYVISIFLPTLRTLCCNGYARKDINFNEMYKEVVAIGQKYIRKEAALEYVSDLALICFETMFENDGETVKEETVVAFLDNLVPHFLLKAYEKNLLKDNPDGNYLCVAPSIPMLLTPQGRAWVSAHYSKLEEPMKILSELITSRSEIIQSKNPIYSTGHVVVFGFEKAYVQLQVEQSEKHYTELLASEMAKKDAKKAKKAKQKAKKAQQTDLPIVDKIDKQSDNNHTERPLNQMAKGDAEKIKTAEQKAKTLHQIDFPMVNEAEEVNKVEGAVSTAKFQQPKENEHRNLTNYEQATLGFAYLPESESNVSFETVLSKKTKKKLKAAEKLTNTAKFEAGTCQLSAMATTEDITMKTNVSRDKNSCLPKPTNADGPNQNSLVSGAKSKKTKTPANKRSHEQRCGGLTRPSDISVMENEDVVPQEMCPKNKTSYLAALKCDISSQSKDHAGQNDNLLRRQADPADQKDLHNDVSEVTTTKKLKKTIIRQSHLNQENFEQDTNVNEISVSDENVREPASKTSAVQLDIPVSIFRESGKSSVQISSGTDLKKNVSQLNENLLSRCKSKRESPKMKDSNQFKSLDNVKCSNSCDKLPFGKASGNVIEKHTEKLFSDQEAKAPMENIPEAEGYSNMTEENAGCTDFLNSTTLISPVNPQLKHHPRDIASSILADDVNPKQPNFEENTKAFKIPEETNIFQRKGHEQCKDISPIGETEYLPTCDLTDDNAQCHKSTKTNVNTLVQLQDKEYETECTKELLFDETVISSSECMQASTRGDSNEDRQVKNQGTTRDVTGKMKQGFKNPTPLPDIPYNTGIAIKTAKLLFGNCALYPVPEEKEDCVSLDVDESYRSTVFHSQTDHFEAAANLELGPSINVETMNTYIPAYDTNDSQMDLCINDNPGEKVSLLCKQFGLASDKLLSEFIDQGHCGLYSPEPVWPQTRTTQMVDEIISIPSNLESDCNEQPSVGQFYHDQSDGLSHGEDQCYDFGWMNAQKLEESRFVDVADDFSRLLYLQRQLANRDHTHWNPFKAEAYQKQCMQDFGDFYVVALNNHRESVKSCLTKGPDGNCTKCEQFVHSTLPSHVNSSVSHAFDTKVDKQSSTNIQHVTDNVKSKGCASTTDAFGSTQSKNAFIKTINLQDDHRCFEITREEETELLHCLFEDVISRADMPNPLGNSEELPLWSKWHSTMQELFKLLPPFLYHVRNIMIPRYPDKFKIGTGLRGTIVCLGYTSLGQSVAVKRIHRSLIASISKQLESLQWEDLSHPNILPLLFSVEDCTYHYLITSACECNLSSYLFSLSVYSHAHDPFITRRLAHQILHGLAYLHSHGIIHGNLKPENVLLDCFGSVRLSDYGWKMPGTEQNHQANNMWTATEMLTEDGIADTKGFDALAAADMQVSGMLIYYTLTQGTHPFMDENTEDMQVNISLGRLNLHPISPEADDLIHSLLKVDPKQRASAKVALCHPFFWEDSSRLTFMKHASFLPELSQIPDAPLFGAANKLVKSLQKVPVFNAMMAELPHPLKLKLKQLTGHDEFQNGLQGILEFIYKLCGQNHDGENAVLIETNFVFPLLPLEVFKSVRIVFPEALLKLHAKDLHMMDTTLLKIL